MADPQRGFILYVVYLWLMLAGMSALQSFFHSQMLISVVHRQHAHIQLQRLVEGVLQQIEHDLLQQRLFSCQYQSRLAGDKRLEQWWQQHSVCHGRVGQQQFQFVIELINRESCKLGDAIYWRLSLHVEHLHMQQLMQSFMLLPETSNTVCNLPNNITFGRQAWRVL